MTKVNSYYLLTKTMPEHSLVHRMYKHCLVDHWLSLMKEHFNERKGHPCPECGAILFVKVQEFSFYCELTESTVVMDSLTHVSCPRCRYADTH